MVKIISFKAIYVLWLREMKRFLRAKSRIVGSLVMPLLLLITLGFGFRKMPIKLDTNEVYQQENNTEIVDKNQEKTPDYLDFLVPGIIGMTMLFASVFAGISVLWDKEFGFLKEIMVAPVNRISIVMGRIAGGLTTGLIRGLMVVGVSLILGFTINGIVEFFITLVFMILIAVTFIGFGLIFASIMKDMQGFNMIMNFIIFPLFFLSGAFYPINNLPKWIRIISYIDPLTYGVDGIRSVLIGTSVFPTYISLIILGFYSVLMIILGAFFFERSKIV